VQNVLNAKVWLLTEDVAGGKQVCSRCLPVTAWSESAQVSGNLVLFSGSGALRKSQNCGADRRPRHVVVVVVVVHFYVSIQPESR